MFGSWCNCGHYFFGTIPSRCPTCGYQFDKRTPNVLYDNKVKYCKNGCGSKVYKEGICAVCFVKSGGRIT